MTLYCELCKRFIGKNESRSEFEQAHQGHPVVQKSKNKARHAFAGPKSAGMCTICGKRPSEVGPHGRSLGVCEKCMRR